MSGIGRVAVVGCGQVGTMLGLALKAAAPVHGVESVGLFDRDRKVAHQSLAAGGGDQALLDEEEVLGFDAILLCVPVMEILAWVERLGPKLRPETLLLDCGTTKLAVVRAMAAHVAAEAVPVGGHPLAGNEGHGPGAARPEQLRDATFCLSPVRSPQQDLARARALVLALGAKPRVVDAAEHDQQVARTIHLPHLLAVALMGTLPPECPGQPPLAGPGFLGATRLAEAEPEMVADFVASNLVPVRSALADLRQRLSELTEMLANRERLSAEVAAAGRRRRQLAGRA